MVARRSRHTKRENWKANWIWSGGDSHPRNLYIYARKSFKLPTGQTNGKLRITADSRYKLFVNGVFVGRGPVRSDPHRQSYDMYDISPHLTKGNNLIAILVNHIGQGTYSYIPGRPAFICEAEITWDGGSEEIITDDTWKVLPAAAWVQSGVRMNRRLGFQEVYDANLEPEGWTQLKFKDAKWPQAVVIGKPPMPPFDRLVQREIPNLREEVVYPAAIISTSDCPPLPAGIEPLDIPAFMASETLSALQEGKVDKSERLLSTKDDAATVKVPQSNGVCVILDFGREVTGCLELTFTKSHGGTVDIGYSEILESGRVKPDRGDTRYTDRLILRKGRQTWCGFESRAFRYVQLDFRDCPKSVSISHVIVREVTYPVEWKGSFECADPLLNRIWQTAAETARLCMQDTYIDSPWRERAQWWDNAAIASRTAYYVFGDTALLEQGLKHIAASQQKDGAIFALYPSATRELFPDFGALWVMSVWDCYATSENRNLLEELYPAVVRWIRWIRRFTDKDGLLSRVHGDVFIDWAEIDRRGEVAALNCLYLGALRAAYKMAEALHHKLDAEEWAGLASALKMAIAKHFWSPDIGLFADARISGKLGEHYSPQTNVLAALFDVANHYQKAAIYRRAAEDNELQPITTPRFASFLIDGLFKSGFVYQALDIMKRKWGGMLSNGATTFWEYFDTSGCLCYASSSGPAYQLQAYVLGIRPTGEPKRVRIEPHPADLEWAHGAVQTASGLVSLDWKTNRRGFTMTVNVPKGVTAEIVPPRWTTPCRVLIDGRDVYDTNIEVGSGTHRVQVLVGSAARQPRRIQEPVITAAEPLPIPPGRGDIETVEQMIRILTELEREQSLAPPEPEKTQPSKRRRTRRTRSTQQAEPKEEIVAAQPEAQEEIRPAKQRRRRTKTKTESPQAEPEAMPVVQPTEEASSEPKTDAPPAKSRTARQRRRRSRAKTEESAASAVETTEPVTEEAPAADKQIQEPAQEKPRSSRRRRRPAAKAPEATVEATKVKEPEPVQVEGVSTEAAEIVSENGKKPRRRPQRRRRKPASDNGVIEPINTDS